MISAAHAQFSQADLMQEEPILIEMVYQLSGNEKQTADAVRQWMDYYKSTDEYSQGVLINTVGFGDVPGTLKRTILALDKSAIQYHINKTFEAEDLIELNATDFTPNVVRQYGDIWNCDEELCGRVWSDADYGKKPINPYNYGPWVTGFMNAYDSRDDRDGLIVFN